MTQQEERRKDYQELTEIKVQLGIAIEQMKNLNLILIGHIADDKATAAEVSDIKLYLATFKGKMIILSSLGGCAFTWVGVLIGIFFKSRGVL